MKQGQESGKEERRRGEEEGEERGGRAEEGVRGRKARRGGRCPLSGSPCLMWDCLIFFAEEGM